MVKSIHLRLDEKFFYMMKADKMFRETKKGRAITWEDYIKILFGFREK